MRKLFVKIYHFIFYKIIFNILKIFPINNKKIVYISHYGSRFGCNPKSMFDYIQENYPDYEHVVVLNNNETEHFQRNLHVRNVSYYSIRFLYEMATSKYWIVNTNLHPDLKPKKHTVYFQTWHGAGAFKKFGYDLPESRKGEKDSWGRDTSHWTKMIASSEKIVDIYSSACGINKRIISPIGIPRNDIFFQTKNIQKLKEQFYQKYKINKNKKIILYAPTYRDNNKDNPIPLNFTSLQRELGEEYVFILKLHPLIANYKLKANNDHFVLNLSDLDDIQELLLVADVLITDYSSVIFDFAITGRPIIFYSYDLGEYERGFYYPYKEFVPGPIVTNQKELVEQLRDYNQLYSENYDSVISFAKEFNAGFDGKSTEKAVNYLFER